MFRSGSEIHNLGFSKLDSPFFFFGILPSHGVEYSLGKFSNGEALRN
jgi:hypothetical protein